jgi:DNA-binding XRE family transcriptional regulator
MARKFSELRDKMPEVARRESDEMAERYRKEMALDELRVARQLTQESLAKTLGVKQASISKMERRADMYLSTLGTIIEAMGGRLVMEAVFPDGKTTLHLRPKVEAKPRVA